MIIALFAVDEDDGMGLNGTMPWPRNKDDLNWFKSTTLNQVVVMGRKTWDSEDMPSPLPKRTNVVFTNHQHWNAPAYQFQGDPCIILPDLQKNNYPDNDIFVIGGPTLLNQSLPIIEKCYITRIPGKYGCDVTINLPDFLKDFVLTNTTVTPSCNIEEYHRCNNI